MVLRGSITLAEKAIVCKVRNRHNLLFAPCLLVQGSSSRFQGCHLGLPQSSPRGGRKLTTQYGQRRWSVYWDAVWGGGILLHKRKRAQERDERVQNNPRISSGNLRKSVCANFGCPRGAVYTRHNESRAFENVLPIQFPFGSGGPALKRPTPISEEELLRYYLRLSLPQFKKSDFVFLACQVLRRIMSYRSALVKCRPIIDTNGCRMGEQISKMTVEDVKEAVKENETRQKTQLTCQVCPAIKMTT